MQVVSRFFQLTNKVRGLNIPRRRVHERDIRSLFDADWYLRVYPDIVCYKDGPLNHYMRVGSAERREPNAYFDSRFYLRQAESLKQYVGNVLTHYLDLGLGLGLSPSPYFDPIWYLRENPDVRRSGMDPFLHFVNHGTHECRNPNPFFDAKWYLQQYEKSECIMEAPLLHYIHVGARKGLLPCSRFDPIGYLSAYADVREAGAPPLQHYLTHGAAEGRKPNPGESAGFPSAFSSRIECIKKPQLGKEVALFVTHSPDGAVKPHVRFRVECLIENQVDVVLIVASDHTTVKLDSLLLQNLSGLYLRGNEGFDFGAWAHVWQIQPETRTSEIVYLVNDSIVGPLSNSLLQTALSKIRGSSADIVGMIDSHETRPHLQSFFIALKRKAITSDAVQDFFFAVRNLPDKQMVIDQYETCFTQSMSAAGFKCAALFPAADTAPINRTIYKWKELIKSGFPYVKITTLRDSYPGVDTSGWHKVVPETEYDVRLVDGLMIAKEKQGCFDANFYLAAYPDVARAGWQAWEHYEQHGRQEGRQPSLSGLSALRDFSPSTDGRRCALIVSHDGNKSGAPILVYNIARILAEKMDTIVLFLGNGEIIEACKAMGIATVGPAYLRNSPGLAEYVIGEIVAAARPDFAIVNSVESRFVLPALAARCVPTITLVHEFAAYIRPGCAFTDTVTWSSETIFSTDLTRENAISYHPGVAIRDCAIIPQGLCEMHAAQSPRDKEAEHRRVARIMRPASFAGLVVLGCGYVEYRKGVDLFICCAAKFVKECPHVPVRFVWMGKGYDPTEHASYSSFLTDQIDRLDVSKNVFFLGEVNDVKYVYKMADIFLLPSRLDPFPNVSIEALSAGLPVLCFDQASGAALKLREEGLATECVAPYLDVDSLTQKLHRMIEQEPLRTKVARSSIQLAKSHFGMSQYVDRLLGIVDHASIRIDQERRDIQTIVDAKLIDYDYYRRACTDANKVDVLVLEYVRGWAKQTACRKMFPGFHPGIYRQATTSLARNEDPLAHYIRAGRPAGCWSNRVIRPEAIEYSGRTKPSCALHIHCFYRELFGDIILRIVQNETHPDLFISFPEGMNKEAICSCVPPQYRGKIFLKSVPNIGRDIGPFLIGFGRQLREYEIVGHVHTKNSIDVEERSQILSWRDFLYENMLGGKHQMIDVIMEEFASDRALGIVFPDDPHAVGWDRNRDFALAIWSRMSSRPLPLDFRFPIGSVFWARSDALEPLYALDLKWSDFPEEPLPSDGSLLHALERLIALAVEEAGYGVATTQCRNVTRPV